MDGLTPLTRTGYPPERTRAALAVLIEVGHLLGEYREDLVVVGGWVPALLIPDGLQTHSGSLDVDLVVDHRAIGETDRYASMLALLERAGYVRDPRQPFIMRRPVVAPSGWAVEIDFLAAEYGGSGRSHRHQRVRDLRARKTRGADLALQAWVEAPLSGVLPDGTMDRVTLRVAGLVAFLVMKAQALTGRLKPKDAYDITYCLRHYPGGIAALSDVLRPWCGHGLVREGLSLLREAFASVGHTGPRLAARFEEPEDAEHLDILARDAYERVAELLRRLDVP